MMAIKVDFIEKPVRFCFGIIGKFIGKHPWYFIIIPLCLSGIMGSGFYFLRERTSNDIEKQFTPLNGDGKLDRQYIQDTFPTNKSMFSSLRLSTEGIYAKVILTHKMNILSTEAFEEVLLVDSGIREMTAESGEEIFNYSDICTRVNHTCYSNILLDMVNYNATNVRSIKLKYPVHNFENRNIHMGYLIGGVKVDGNATVLSAEAIQLVFYLQEDNEKSDSWLTKFMDLLSRPNTTQIKLFYFTTKSRQEEFEKTSKGVITFFAIAYVITISFSTLSCIRLDNVRNKVWMACLGVFSTCLAVLSSFGLLLAMGVPFVMTVGTSPFLILGIGVDDMFIMISSWQQTNVKDNVPNRLSHTYKAAAISITITTLTDVLAFFLSYSNPFGSIQSFCLYTGTAVLFCYLYNVTFFGACLALNGRREESNRHWFTCMRVPDQPPQEGSRTFAVCCVGGTYNHDTEMEVEQPMQKFLRQYYGPCLVTNWMRAAVCVVYGVYLAMGMYGCYYLKQGIDLGNLANDESYIQDYYGKERKYFSEYGAMVMLVVNGTYPYWEEDARRNLSMCFKEYQKLTKVSSTFSVSWLQSLEDFTNKTQQINSEDTFTQSLLSFLDHNPLFRQDLNISSNNMIYASRFFLQTVNISSSEDERGMLMDFRKKKCDIPVVVYHPSFIYYDQYIVIEDITVQTVVVVTVVMLVISLLLIPSPVCALWVTFAIASVIIGVIGFMTHCGINLDSISMINLITCIGFAVDYSAHISYAFVSSPKTEPNERVVEALSSLGYPILQGALSTLAGIVVLAASSSYIFRTFFKIMSLVILFGLLHSIAFIPVFLYSLGTCSKKKSESSPQGVLN